MKNILKDKKVLITGATGGLGREFCYQLSDFGVKLYITSKTNDKLDSLQNELVNKGVECKSKCVDFTKSKNISDHLFVDVDILINCAGVYIEKNLDSLTIEDYDEIFDINLKTPFMLIKEVSKNMKKHRWGRIINIGSNSSYIGKENRSLYCSTKHAILGLSRSINQELKNYNIKTFCFSPGGLQTEMGKQVSDVNYPRFIRPRELVSFVIHTIQYDENMMLDEIKINRTGI